MGCRGYTVTACGLVLSELFVAILISANHRLTSAGGTIGPEPKIPRKFPKPGKAFLYLPGALLA